LFKIKTMSTLVLKNNLHKLVVETDDETLLQQVQLFFLALKDKKATTEDWWQTISETERNLINKGLEDSANGKLISHEIARASINKILGKA
jgi:hypothetical protein